MLQSRITLPYPGYSISAQDDYVNCGVDPGSIQGSHWPISLTRKYILQNTRELLIIQFGVSIKMGYKRDILHAACKVEYQLYIIIVELTTDVFHHFLF